MTIRELQENAKTQGVASLGIKYNTPSVNHHSWNQKEGRTNRHYIARTQSEKYWFMRIIRENCGIIGEPSGYGDGYYISFMATDKEAELIEKELQELF